MNRTLRNVVAVLVLTAFTAIAVVATVQATDRIAGTDTATAASAQTSQVATQSESGSTDTQGYDQGSSQQSSDQSQTGPYGYPMSVYTPDANGLMYCPATGCAESSCHALQ